MIQSASGSFSMNLARSQKFRRSSCNLAVIGDIMSFEIYFNCRHW